MSKPLRVLVVDDQLEVAQSLASVVRTWHHEVELAYSGDQALEVAERFQPHAIMLDIMMPGMDGYAVAQKLREVVNLKECTIIGVTALGDSEHRHQGWDNGFVHYMTKPIEPPALKKVLEGIARTVEVEEKRRSKAVSDLTAKLEKRLKVV
jgi:DNA-binding response OmpR family regulator